MITVKELIEKLQTIDPNAFVVIPGHSDAWDYDDLYWPSNGLKLLTLKEKSFEDWAGKYERTDFKTDKSFWAYCL